MGSNQVIQNYIKTNEATAELGITAILQRDKSFICDIGFKMKTKTMGMIWSKTL